MQARVALPMQNRRVADVCPMAYLFHVFFF